MKKRTILSAGLAFAALGLISWGFKGHRAVATIAQNHLNTNVAYVASAYLKGEPMEAVSTWADENRDPKTASWHYINLPLGLSRDAFVKAVQESDNNIYTAILKTEATLKDANASTEAKNEAIKYLIHLVGDAHQPMHVSRKEDKGGNTIQLRFDNKGTNLHSLWDSKLIDKEGLSQEDIVKTYDTATPADIKKWQSDSPIEWLWESYQITTELYASAKPGQDIDDIYYQKYIPVIHKRIDQAGIRLAGELNRLLAGQKIKAALPAVAQPTVAAAPAAVKLEEVKNSIGKTVTVSGKVFSSRDIGSMTLVNLGAAYPNQLLTVALKGKAKELGNQLGNKTITVEGEVIDYKGKPEIIITDPAKIKL
ncbi:S1/P1 nuclease [Mucilaginibacter roseus]|uniref:S1/P1 nuclease n=1 Tax=Mucilaginibacter roseus TaxID=1528868 RepID=A0ABS8TZ48_9SPHI|nr:S1/P1 nuclease [Mucilaginibacter roseus]MCD8739098.1 S1/P1 nuclease [Mucilaginibacter roseus]